MMNKVNLIPKIIINKLLILIVYYTVIMQFFVTNAKFYSTLRIILMLAIVALFLIVMLLNRGLYINKLLYLFIVISYISFIIGLILSVIFGNPIFELTILIPLIMMILGLNIKLSDRERQVLMYGYVLLTGALGIYFVLKYGSGFVISAQYILAQKNQIGSIIGISIVIILYNLLVKRQHVFYNSLLLIVNLLPLLILRTRTIVIGVIVIFFYLLLKNIAFQIKNKRIFKLIIIIFGIIILLTSNQVVSYFYDVFFLNVDTNDINSISSNRLESYIKSVPFILENFLFGELIVNANNFDPHNFVLYTLQKKGLILSFSIILIYFYFLIFMLKNLVHSKLNKISIPTLLLLLAFISSLFEYQAPFGPGTTQLITWFFIGNSMRKGDFDEWKSEYNSSSTRV